MTLVDTNLLIYATFSDMPEHAAARSWLSAVLTEPDATIAFCWPVMYAFLRLITSTRVFGNNAVSVSKGWEVLEAYLQPPASRVVTAGPGHAGIAGDLARTPGLRSDDVPDVEIAALAIEHGVVLATRDRGFRRFSGLRVLDPLAG